ncbi:RNA polymerase factor sigma-54 [Candidatus Sumerlaeota bacterium]|nr:RNA polymerase factor sigma-54 [Candidatus Sumerlaeota bacterium]
MTPQMQQSIQLLQMNSMDLETLIRDEMMENPFLEIGDEEENLHTESPDEAADAAPAAEGPEDAPAGLSEEASKAAEAEGAYEDGEPGEEYSSHEFTSSLSGGAEADGTEEHSDPSSQSDGSEDFQHMADTDANWNEEFEDSDTASYSNANEDPEEHDFTTYTSAKEGLYDSLMRQLRLSILAGRNYEIGEFIVGSLNNDGYLDSSLTNQALIVGYPQELIVPDEAGAAEKVDESLRRLLARLHGGENPDAFVGMKRKELVLRITADFLKSTYDEVASMKKDEQLVRLIAKRIRRDYEDVADLSPNDLILEAIAFRTKATADAVFDVLEVIQEFEPTGVGARDLAECLRLQCEEKEIRNRVLYQVLDSHLEDLQQKRFKEIARALNVGEEQVMEVFNLLSKLDPKPGRSTTKDRPQYITPDVYVKKIDGKYLYFLNEGDSARLKVASNYRRLMMSKAERKEAAAAGNGASTTTSNASNGASETEGMWEEVAGPSASAILQMDQDYASEKFKNAVWLIRNIEKRKSTILRVTEAIMEYQKEFLDKGIEHLRPLTLRDIAERVGMHESTIARVTTKKYVETPRGIFELKFFFSSGLETDDGEAASSRSIKELLTQMIEGEEKKRPYSDQKIADMLRHKGFQIARRTVAKYREQLRILPAKLRKEVK